MNNIYPSRVFSAMRPTGRPHIGHLYGVIRSWVNLQYEHECLFMVADLHALTTTYSTTKDMQSHIFNLVVDWLACGVDPSQANIFVQSHVPAHSELYTLLSMITPLSWLERVPSYKDLLDRDDLKKYDTYGCLGYPLLQSADILLYNTTYVPVGEDQLFHIELTREVARRFNYLYGREEGFELKALAAQKKLGSKKAALYNSLRINYQQNGDEDSLEQARYLLKDAVNLTIGDRERLFAFLEDKSRVILAEPQEVTNNLPKLIGVDGTKMSKSRNNGIYIRDNNDRIKKIVMEMPTDPARVRRTDPGDPDRCPVWQLHQVYSTEEVKHWASSGCLSAKIGCVDCKKPLIDKIIQEQEEIKEKAKPYLEDYTVIRNILADGAYKAQEIANNTLSQIRKVMNI